MTTTPGTRSSLTVVNAESTNIGTGTAVMALIVAEALRRQHTIGIKSIQFEDQRGIGVLTYDAGSRQHLANALAFPKATEDFRVRGIGIGTARTGEMAGVPVRIWNVEE